MTYRTSSPQSSRTVSVFVSGEPLDPEKEYTVATNDFLAAGGDGYTSFDDAIRKSGESTVRGGLIRSGTMSYSDPGRWLRDVVVSHVKTYGRIAPVVEGRMKEVP